MDYAIIIRTRSPSSRRPSRPIVNSLIIIAMIIIITITISSNNSNNALFSVSFNISNYQ